MLGEFDSRKDSHQPNWNEGLSFLNLRFRELFGSKLSGLHPFDNIAIIHRVKNRNVGCEFMRHQSLK